MSHRRWSIAGLPERVEVTTDGTHGGAVALDGRPGTMSPADRVAFYLCTMKKLPFDRVTPNVHVSSDQMCVTGNKDITAILDAYDGLPTAQLVLSGMMEGG